ncbi:uncharacterized protein VTP21DRAFT_10977 [Calcarisporiella thermophila]|uniref:uncharacterized protein n=1 Tax=Calcarisporiella thermophila TaxID=911321 RepID=UPI00374390CE
MSTSRPSYINPDGGGVGDGASTHQTPAKSSIHDRSTGKSLDIFSLIPPASPAKTPTPQNTPQHQLSSPASNHIDQQRLEREKHLKRDREKADEIKRSLDSRIETWLQLPGVAAEVKAIVKNCEEKFGTPDGEYHLPDMKKLPPSKWYRMREALDNDVQLLRNPFHAFHLAEMFGIDTSQLNRNLMGDAPSQPHHVYDSTGKPTYMRLREEQNIRWANDCIKTGNEHAREHDFEKAIQQYNNAIRVCAEYPDAFVARGAAYANMGQWDNAVNDLQKALELDPSHVNAKKYLQITSQKKRQGNQKSKYDFVSPTPEEMFGALIDHHRQNVTQTNMVSSTEKKRAKKHDNTHPLSISLPTAPRSHHSREPHPPPAPVERPHAPPPPPPLYPPPSSFSTTLTPCCKFFWCRISIC